MDDRTDDEGEPEVDFEAVTELQIENLQETFDGFDEQLVDAAYREMPLNENAGMDAVEYRLAVVQEFLSLTGCPVKRKEGQRYRSVEESRLDRAFHRVSGAYDVSESDIKSLSVS